MVKKLTANGELRATHIGRALRFREAEIERLTIDNTAGDASEAT